MKELETDKDIIIVKQKAFITYLEYELSKVNLENGKLLSEIEYLENELKKVIKENKKFLAEAKSYENQVSITRHLEEKLKEKNILIRELRNESVHHH